MTETDPYLQCKAGLLAQIRTLTTYFTEDVNWQVSDDDANLNRGADYYFITLPSSFPSRRVDGKTKLFVWNIVADLYVRYTTRVESVRKFEVFRGAVVTLLHSDPTLGSTKNVSDVLASANGQIMQDIPGDNPNFIIQTITVAITQRVAVVS